MEKIKNGGPAFPQLSEIGEIAYTTNGMTLRDYFAAKALTGVIGRRWEDENGKVPDDVMDRWARAAYLTADAMLRAREA